MSSDRYLVISSDCHAGLPNAQYREWLDPEYRDAFDQSLADRARMMELAARGILNEEFAEEWERENEEGLQGGWDAARRDKELDADGVVGEVIFPDADAVHRRRVGAVRCRACRRAPTRRPTCSWPAPAPTTAGWPSCARTPPSAGPAWPSCRSSTPRPRSPRSRRARESGLRGGILIPSMWGTEPPYHDARYEPVWAACEDLQMPVHVHSRLGRQGGVRARTSACTPPRCGGGRPGRCTSCCGRACSSATPACASSSPSAARSGPPTCCGRWTPCTTASTAPGSSASS